MPQGTGGYKPFFVSISAYAQRPVGSAVKSGSIDPTEQRLGENQLALPLKGGTVQGGFAPLRALYKTPRSKKKRERARS